MKEANPEVTTACCLTVWLKKHDGRQVRQLRNKLMKVGSKDAVMVFGQCLKIFVICGFLLALRPGLVIASHYDEVDAHTFESDFVYSPYVGRAYPDQVLLGDSQFHTNLSFDDGLVDTLLDVDEGFR